jgi:hypothetical protein
VENSRSEGERGVLFMPGEFQLGFSHPFSKYLNTQLLVHLS